jgi:hypothetical protein
MIPDLSIYTVRIAYERQAKDARSDYIASLLLQARGAIGRWLARKPENGFGPVDRIGTASNLPV